MWFQPSMILPKEIRNAYKKVGGYGPEWLQVVEAANRCSKFI